MNEFRFICARLILDERVLKILSVTERHRDLDTKKTTPNIEVCSESLGAMLEYWYIERTLLNHRSCRDQFHEGLFIFNSICDTLFHIGNSIICWCVIGKWWNSHVMLIKKKETAVFLFILSLVLICYSCMNKHICPKRNFFTEN